MAGNTSETVKQIKCYVNPMKLSDGRTDYFVTIECEGRITTPFVFRERFKADYETAHLNYIFNGGDEPSLMDFRPD
jgi:hypothetical protein